MLRKQKHKDLKKKKRRNKKKFKKIKIVFHKFNRFKRFFKYFFTRFRKRKSKYLKKNYPKNVLFTDRSILILYFYNLVKMYYFNKFSFLNIFKKKLNFIKIFIVDFIFFFCFCFFKIITSYRIFTQKLFKKYNLKTFFIFNLFNNISVYTTLQSTKFNYFNNLSKNHILYQKVTIIRIFSYKLKKIICKFKEKLYLFYNYKFYKSKSTKLFKKNINLLFKIRLASSRKRFSRKGVLYLLLQSFSNFLKSNTIIHLFSRKLNFKFFFFTNIFLILKKRWRFFKNIKTYKKKFNKLFFYKILKKTNTPLIDFYKPELKRKIVNLFSNKTMFDVTKFVYNYVLNFCEYLLKIKTMFTVATNNRENKFLFLKLEVKKLVRLMKHYHMKVGRGLFLAELIDITLISFFRKDLIILKNWLKSTMEKMIIKKHKKFNILLKYLFQKYLWKYFVSFNCYGFKLYLSGKIGVTGNSKTRSYSILWGAYSLTKKKFRLDYIQEIIRTNTGVLGLTMLLTY